MNDAAGTAGKGGKCSDGQASGAGGGTAVYNNQAGSGTANSGSGGGGAGKSDGKHGLKGGTGGSGIVIILVEN